MFWALLCLAQDQAPSRELVLSFTSLCLFIILLSTHLLRVALLWLRSTAKTWSGLLLRAFPWVVFSALSAASAIVWIVPEVINLSADMETVTPLGLGPWEAVFALSFYFALWTGIYLAGQNLRANHLLLSHPYDAQPFVLDGELRQRREQRCPHFLFHSLGIVRGLMPQEADKAKEAITLVSDLLRAVLDSEHSEFVSLKDELRTVRSYLALEKLRFGDQMTVEIEIQNEAQRCPVPPFILQALVENAVKFGVASRAEGGTVKITAALVERSLLLTVENSAYAIPAIPGTGLGLPNARERLQRLYKKDHRLELDFREDGSVVAMLELPAKARPASALNLGAH